MSFSFDTIYVFYFLAAASAVLFVEGIYLLFYSSSSYRSRVNRRLVSMKGEQTRENIVVQLRKDRGLTGSGDFRLPIVSFNRLLLQSGMTAGFSKLAIIVGIGACGAFGVVMIVYGSIFLAGLVGLSCGLLLPLLVLRIMRSRRQKAFGMQFPDAIDIIMRSLRAGHPVPIAVTMVGREMPDPIGSEFGIVADEITYGADLESAMRNLYFRVGQEDLALFVTAVAIQGSTGGNLSEILEKLSSVRRQRFKMRRKIKALAAEGRFSAFLLSGLPIAMFLVLQVMAPDFYGLVWKFEMTKIVLACAGGWMAMGNLIMFKLVNYKI